MLKLGDKFFMEAQCEYCQVFGGYGQLIWQTIHWNIYLAPSQRYLGTCVVALKRHCQDLSQVNHDEWIDFSRVVRKLELALERAFKPTLYNWSCFKNSAFRSENPEPEVHWNFIPRYKDPVTFNELIFHDPDFGYIPLPEKREIPPEIMEKLSNIIKDHME